MSKSSKKWLQSLSDEAYKKMKKIAYKKYQIGVSAYVRMSILEKMERDDKDG